MQVGVSIYSCLRHTVDFLRTFSPGVAHLVIIGHFIMVLLIGECTLRESLHTVSLLCVCSQAIVMGLTVLGSATATGAGLGRLTFTTKLATWRVPAHLRMILAISRLLNLQSGQLDRLNKNKGFPRPLVVVVNLGLWHPSLGPIHQHVGYHVVQGNTPIALVVVNRTAQTHRWTWIQWSCSAWNWSVLALVVV